MPVPAGDDVERLRGQLFVREEEDVELVGQEGGGGWVAGGGYGGEVVGVEVGGEVGYPAFWGGGRR